MHRTALIAPISFPSGVRLRGFVSLMKLRLNSLVVFAVGAGALIADPRAIEAWPFLALLFGVLLAAAGTSALNMALEWERDVRMRRTELRPIPAGIVTQREGLVFGAALAASGLALLAAATTVEAVILTAATVVSYVGLYTPLKPHTTWNTLVGAFPGALPPLVGWAAMTGRVPLPALSLFAIVFFWQFPHFFAIASLHREDYRRGGFRMLPVLDRSGLVTAHRVVATALILLPVSLLPTVCGLAGRGYAIAALVLSGLYLAAAAQAAVRRNRSGWRLLLWTSFLHLPGVFSVLVIERLWS